MGCRLVKASEYKDYELFNRHSKLYHNAEEHRYHEIRESINRANKRMESLEKIFEILTNDTRLKDIIEQINKNHNNINKDVLQQQQDEKHEQSTTSEN